MRRTESLLFLLLVCLAGGIASLSAQGVRDATFNGQIAKGQGQGYVSAVQADGKILIGGNFTDAGGVARSYLVRVNPVNGSIDTGFNAGGVGPNGAVVAILVLPDGKIMIGGEFTSYNGVSANYIARLNADGSRDNGFAGSGVGVAGAGGRITSIIRQPDGKIVAAGQRVTTYNGATSWGLFRANTDGSRDTSFTSFFGAAPGLEEVILQPDGKIIMVGGMTGYNNVSRTGIIRMNSDGSIDNTFNGGGAGTDAPVSAVALQADGDVVIGGAFSSYNGAPTGPFIRLLSNGTVDGSFVPPTLSPATSYIESIAIQTDGAIVAAGAMFYSGGAMMPAIRVNTSGTLDSAFNIAASDNLAYNVNITSGGDILLTGWFSRLGATDRGGVARFTSGGAVDAVFAPSLNDGGRAQNVLIQTDGKVIAVGNFQTANGVSYKDIVRFNTDGTVDQSFVSGLGTAANNLTYARNVLAAKLQPDGKILVAGDFGSFNGSGKNSLVRLNGNGSVDTSFTMDQSAFDPANVLWIYDLAVDPAGKIICAGLSYAPGSSNANGVWRLNSDGSLDTSFARKTVNSQALGITLTSDGKYLVSGNFTQYDGTSSQRIVKVNTDGTKDTSFTGTANGRVVNALEQPDGKLIVYGSFTTLGGLSRIRIGRLNTDGTADSSFVSAGANDTVRSVIRLDSGNLLVGGSFTAYGPTPIYKLMILDPNGAIVSAFSSGFDPAVTVNALAKQSDGKVIVGGTFDTYSGAASGDIVRLTGPSFTVPQTGPTAFDFDGDGKADLSLFRPGNSGWYWLRSTDLGATVVQPFGLATDIPTPADFDGDGKADIAVWRDESSDPDRANFYILKSSDSTMAIEQFGRTGDDPTIVGDYDGDGHADLAVYREGSSGGQSYFYYRSVGSAVGSFVTMPWGTTGDKPVKGDYNADGKSDFAVFRPSNGVWYIAENGTANYQYKQWGIATDKLVPADYDGDGATDAAVYRDGTWYILQSSSGTPQYGQFGIATDTPTPADYDGDGKADLAVFRAGTWYLLNSTAGFSAVQFGTAGDNPLPSLFVH